MGHANKERNTGLPRSSLIVKIALKLFEMVAPGVCVCVECVRCFPPFLLDNELLRSVRSSFAVFRREFEIGREEQPEVWGFIDN